MPKRDRLGKGLGALLGEYLGEEAPAEEQSARRIAVSAIAPNPFQPRREFADEELADLAASIRENGLLQPIVVRPAPGSAGGEWELVAGERRWRAVTRLGWREVPSIVREVDDRTLLVLALVENLQRSGLNALEEALGYQRLQSEFQLSHQSIADAVGKDRSTITNSLRLLQLPPSVRRLVSEGRLSAGHARALLSAGNEHRMAELARKAADEGWSVRDTESRAKGTRAGGRRGGRRPARTRSAAERELEAELQRALGTAARIRPARSGKGRIEIPYYSAEDFERLYELLVGRSATDIVS